MRQGRSGYAIGEMPSPALTTRTGHLWFPGARMLKIVVMKLLVPIGPGAMSIWPHCSRLRATLLWFSPAPEIPRFNGTESTQWCSSRLRPNPMGLG